MNPIKNDAILGKAHFFRQTLIKPLVNGRGSISAIWQSSLCSSFIFFVRREMGKTCSTKFVFLITSIRNPWLAARFLSE